MNEELEARIWCPKCRVEKFQVWRKLTENGQAYENVTHPASIHADARKRCECGAQLERKP